MRNILQMTSPIKGIKLRLDAEITRELIDHHLQEDNRLRSIYDSQIDGLRINFYNHSINEQPRVAYFVYRQKGVRGGYIDYTLGDAAFISVDLVKEIAASFNANTKLTLITDNIGVATLEIQKAQCLRKRKEKELERTTCKHMQLQEKIKRNDEQLKALLKNNHILKKNIKNTAGFVNGLTGNNVNKLPPHISFHPEEIVNFSFPFSKKTSIVRGIYFLIHHEAIVYVGQSVDIITRLHTHLRYKSFDRVSVLMVPERAELDDVERFFIHSLNPKLNGKTSKKLSSMWMESLALSGIRSNITEVLNIGLIPT